MKQPPRAEKKLCVENNGFKLIKNGFFENGTLTTCRKSHFPNANSENKYNKVQIARNYVKTTSNDVLIHDRHN